MAEIILEAITKEGLELPTSLSAATAGGDFIKAVSSGVFIAVENSSGSPRVVTVVTPQADAICPPFGEVAITDIVINVADGETQLFAIPAGYSDSSNNFPITYDDESGLAIGAFSIAP